VNPSGAAGPSSRWRIFFASLHDITAAGIRGNVGTIAGSSRDVWRTAAFPGVSGSPCQNQLYLPLPR
jgi:hypothetical protein